MLSAMATPWPIAPMKAVSATKMPTGGDWMYEPKWDGHRVLARRRGARFDAVSSTGKPKDPQWPWLKSAVEAATDHDVILDGEVIAYADDGRHSFQLVGSRERRHAYVAFDILAVDGKECLGLPWTERREVLLATITPSDRLSITPVSDDADAMESATRAQRFEGVIAKRPSSTYQPGRRSPSWVKVKYRHEQEMVIGGYKLGEGNRLGSFGSLLVGVNDAAGDLRFVSAVGTGFNDTTLKVIMNELRARETDACPFVDPPKLPRGSYRWVRPELVAQVAFHEWTDGGGLRAPVYLGLRDDTDPKDVIRET
jgi:bifunctional non-homologous end joining protein LigD